MTKVEKIARFSDDGELTYEFGDEFWVVCPRCQGKARVSQPANSSDERRENLFAPHELVCYECPYRAAQSDGGALIGGNFDWYFRLPLWLQISCCGETLWAYNRKHLEFIENYVAAKLRERTPNINGSLASRFPNWIKSAKNRDEILKAVGKLKEKLNGKS